MTIASEITRIQNNIAAAYTAASGKGATLPATENSDNLATCIGSIPSGGTSPTGLKVNVTFENGADWDYVEYIRINVIKNSPPDFDLAQGDTRAYLPITLTGPISAGETVYYEASPVGKEGASISPESGSITLQSDYAELNFVVSLD